MNGSSLLCRLHPASLTALRSASIIIRSSSSKADTSVTPSPPLSLILGWAYSKPHQRAKFGNVHRRVSLPTPGGGALAPSVLEFKLEDPVMFTFDQDLQREKVRQLLVAMREHMGVTEDSPPVPVLTHTFSLNGYITYMHLQRLIEEGEGAPFFIRGGIYDSGPGPWTWSSNIYFPWGGNTGYLGLRQRPNPNFPAFAFFWISAAVEKRGIVRSVGETAQLLMLFRENFKKYHPQGYLSPMEHILGGDKGKHPLLILYSTNDPIIPHTFMEGVIKLHRDAGRSIQGVNFVTSGHVQHLKEFPELYEEKVAEFAEECLGPEVLAAGSKR